GQVGIAVTIEVCNRQVERINAGADQRRTGEGAAAVAQQDRHRVAEVICHREVRLSVAVEIADRDALRSSALRAEARRGTEGPVAGTEKDRDGAAAEIRRRQVQPAVAIEVAYSHLARVVASLVLARRHKSAG